MSAQQSTILPRDVQPAASYEEALAAAELCVKLLHSQFGATRVVPLGSVRDRLSWHESSDLDLAVEGIAPEQFFRAWSSLRKVMSPSLQVDLVALETANPRLRDRILNEENMSADPIVRLRGLIENELQSLQQIVNLLVEAQSELCDPPSQFQLNGLASYVYKFYTGCERILERVVTQIDQQLPQGAYSHANLLAKVAQPLPDLRPAVIDAELWDQFQTLLDFRHFFRHAYGFTLEWLSLKPLVEAIPQVLEIFRQQLSQFFDQLQSKGKA